MVLNLLMTFCYISGIVAAVSGHEDLQKYASSKREGKVFSLFSVVQFDNSQCSAANGLLGTCMTSDECSSASGTSSGNCAAGFGVCCVFTVSTCGSAVGTNCTYIQNPGYPSAFSTVSTTCSYTVSRFASDICQVRLDFATLVTAAPPAATGLCSTVDSIAITQPTGGLIPTICGTLTGEHVYIETGSSGTMATIAFTIGSTTATRQWNIKVSAIECTASFRAPTDCLQYFTGNSGSVMSFNNQGGILLQSQQYKVCIRQEIGMCQIAWRTSSTTSPDPFLFEDGSTTVAEVTCANSNVQIQIPLDAQTTICGGIFCNEDTTTVGCTIQTDEVPFALNVFVDNTDAVSFTGFNLDYTQVPCGNMATS